MMYSHDGYPLKTALPHLLLRLTRVLHVITADLYFYAELPRLPYIDNSRCIAMKETPENSPTPPTPTLYPCFTRKQGWCVFLRRTTPSTLYHGILHEVSLSMDPPETRPTPPTPTFYSWFTRKYDRFVFIRRTTPSTLYHGILHEVSPSMDPPDNSPTPPTPTF